MTIYYAPSGIIKRVRENRPLWMCSHLEANMDLAPYAIHWGTGCSDGKCEVGLEQPHSDFLMCYECCPSKVDCTPASLHRGWLRFAGHHAF